MMNTILHFLNSFSKCIFQVLHRGLRTAAASLLCCSPQPQPGQVWFGSNNLKVYLWDRNHKQAGIVFFFLIKLKYVGSEKLGDTSSLAPPSPLSLPGHCDPPPHLAAAEFSAKTRSRFKTSSPHVQEFDRKLFQKLRCLWGRRKTCNCALEIICKYSNI